MNSLRDVIWFDFVDPIEIGVEFVSAKWSLAKVLILRARFLFVFVLQIEQIGFLEDLGGKPLMKKVPSQKGPKGRVLKSFTSPGNGPTIAAPLFTVIALMIVPRRVQL